MQTLKLAHEFFLNIDNDTKRGTIRAGKRDISLGKLKLVSAADPDVIRIVQATRVSHKIVAHLTTDDAALDGYQETAELFRVLRQFYPHLAGNDPVTIIEFRP